MITVFVDAAETVGTLLSRFGGFEGDMTILQSPPKAGESGQELERSLSSVYCGVFSFSDILYVTMKYQLVFFATSDNHSPVVDFIRSLDIQTRTKIDRIAAQLANLGPQIRPPQSKQVASNLFELRVRGKVEVRIFYCFSNKSIWLLHAIVKKTIKIPQKELKLALSRKEQIAS